MHPPRRARGTLSDAPGPPARERSAEAAGRSGVREADSLLAISSNDKSGAFHRSLARTRGLAALTQHTAQDARLGHVEGRRDPADRRNHAAASARQGLRCSAITAMAFSLVRSRSRCSSAQPRPGLASLRCAARRSAAESRRSRLRRLRPYGRKLCAPTLTHDSRCLTSARCADRCRQSSVLRSARKA